MQTDFIWWERKDAGRCVVHRYDDPSRDWKKIRKERKDWRVTMGEPKRLLLRRDHFPSSWKNQEPFDSSMIPGRTQIWVRDPNGQFLPADISGEKKDIAINVPKNIDLNGLYLIGSHSDAGEIDMGLDRGIARVYFYAKAIVWHYRKDGVKGKKSRFFFRNPDRIALEIGPVEAQLEQSPHQEYEMLVLYRGQPLSNARVTILTEGGWQKTLSTDSHGRFRVTPLGSKLKSKIWERYLYVVRHYDPARGEYHCSTLPMIVHRAWPEWQSKSRGFMLWVVLGVGLTVCIVAGTIYRKKRRDRTTMIKFENRRTKKVD